MRAGQRPGDGREAGGCTVRALVTRYYDPTTGTFLTRDPLEVQTQAPYSYADNDPLDSSDPSGEHFCIGPVCVGWHPSSWNSVLSYV